MAFLVLIPRPALSGSLEKKLDTIVRISASHGGWVDYHALDTFSKSELLVAAKHENVHMRDIALLHLKSRFPHDLTPAELTDISAELLRGDTRSCMDAAGILGANMSVGRDILIADLRGKQDLAAVCAASTLLLSPENDDVGLKHEALTRLLQCLIDCASGSENAAVNYLINHTNHADALPWFEKTLTDVSLSTSARGVVAGVWQSFATENELPFAKRLLHDDGSTVRMFAIEVMGKSKSEGAVKEIVRSTRDPDIRVRHAAYMTLWGMNNMLALPAFIDGLANQDDDVFSESIRGIEALKAKGALPKLIAILRKGESARTKPTSNERAVGNAISSITGEKFEFLSPGFCGTPALSSGEKIRRGKEVGGERGKALVEEGEKELADFKSMINSSIAESESKSVTERTRLLIWWDSTGRRLFHE